MTTALVILSVLMAVICVWLFRHTINVTPWQETRPTDVARGNGELSMPPVQVGLVVFLAVATSLFALFVSAYYMRMVEADWTNFPLNPSTISSELQFFAITSTNRISVPYCAFSSLEGRSCSSKRITGTLRC